MTHQAVSAIDETLEQHPDMLPEFRERFMRIREKWVARIAENEAVAARALTSQTETDTTTERKARLQHVKQEITKFEAEWLVQVQTQSKMARFIVARLNDRSN